MTGRAMSGRRGLISLAAMLLGCVQVAGARKVLSKFDYHFDAGAETHGFTHNDPGSGGRAEWRPRGALRSIGCLKVTGPFATCDSKYAWFRTGGSTLSFHYYLHGYAGFRCRLNVARDEDRERFGSYANWRPARPVQDRWQFVQIPLAELVGDAKSKPKAYAELVFKSLTFIARDARGKGAYLLLDNVRLGPRIEEKDIVVRRRGRQTFGKAVRTLLDFEDAAQVKLLGDLTDLTVERSDAWASGGKWSVKLTCKAGKPWTTFELARSLLKGWEKYDYLAMDLYTEDANFVAFRPELWDTASRDYYTRSTYEGAGGPPVPPVHKGRTRVLIDLRKARRNGKEHMSYAELGPADKVDPAKLTKCKAWFVTAKLKRDYVVYLDEVRLLQAGALPSNMRVPLPKGAVAFDFGEGSPLVEGFTEVSLVDAYDAASPYGFVRFEGVRARGRDWPDALTGDYVGPAADPAEAGRPASFEFRAKVPDGRYLVWVCGGFFPVPNVYTDLNVNGRLLFSAEMTARTFYSRRWYFRFLDTLYSERPGALWKDYVARTHPATTFETRVRGGELLVKGTHAFLSALVLVPVERKAEFGRMVERIASERIRYFYRDLFVERPGNEPCRVTDEHFVLFAPAEGKTVMPWSGIDAADALKLSKVAAPGEAISLPVGVRSFRDAPELKLSVTDLRGPGGAVLPAERVGISLQRYISNGRRIEPWCLLPRDRVPLEKGLTRSFWLRLRVPAGAAAGKYTGEVRAAAGDVRRSMPLEIEVFAVRLADDVPLAIGYYYSPPDSGQWAMLDAVKDFQAERDRILREQMAVLHDHGMTSVQLPTPTVTGLRGSGVTLDFRRTEKVALAAKAAGLHAAPAQRALVYTLSLGRAIGPKLAGGRPVGTGDELRLEGFATAYTSAVMQLTEWAQRAGVPIVHWVVDEPREQPNPWNRNFADTVSYLRLAGQVPGAVRMVTPMGDTNRGRDYLPMLDHMEIVATHATKSSARMIRRAMAGPKPALWIYNVGQDRYSNGFYVWRVGAGGKHEWHFNQWVSEAPAAGYPGREMHNPFLAYEFGKATVPAPPEFPGAMLPTARLLTMSAGAADFRYLHTLERAVAARRSDAARAADVAEARKLLAALKKVIPVLPEVKGLASPEDLALVGKGIAGGRPDLETWKRKVAELIARLQRG